MSASEAFTTPTPPTLPAGAPSRIASDPAGPQPASAIRAAASHRRGDAVAADRDGGGFERAVVLLLGSGDEDLGARLELVLAAGDVGDDHGLGRDDDLLFP